MSMANCPKCQQKLHHVTAKGDKDCGFVTTICTHCKQSWIELFWIEEGRLCGIYFPIERGKAYLSK